MPSSIESEGLRSSCAGHFASHPFPLRFAPRRCTRFSTGAVMIAVFRIHSAAQSAVQYAKRANRTALAASAKFESPTLQLAPLNRVLPTPFRLSTARRNCAMSGANVWNYPVLYQRAQRPNGNVAAVASPFVPLPSRSIATEWSHADRWHQDDSCIFIVLHYHHAMPRPSKQNQRSYIAIRLVRTTGIRSTNRLLDSHPPDVETGRLKVSKPLASRYQARLVSTWIGC